MQLTAHEKETLIAVAKFQDLYGCGISATNLAGLLNFTRQTAHRRLTDLKAAGVLIQRSRHYFLNKRGAEYAAQYQLQGGDKNARPHY